MAFTSSLKSNRLLQSRRFTQDRLGDSQEAFTRVLDLNASEIYAQQDLIPTSSLPYSGSSQNGSTVIVNGQSVLKFWYRQRLTPSNTLNNSETSYNTWFFLDPTSSAEFTNGVNPGVLSVNQQDNFISPKYATSLGGTTEDTTPGYQVKLTDNGTIVDPATYTFDYKTGVLQFNGQSGYTTITKDIRLTAYQYIGSTLANLSTSLTASYAITSSYSATASYAINAGAGSGFPFSGSAVITGSMTIVGESVTTSPTIGQSLQGGKVGYILTASDAGYNANYYKGIITSETDQSPIIWGIEGNLTSATSSLIGFGQSNTNKIIAVEGGSYPYAASASDAYVTGGYSDWYLPSFDELQQLYNNKNTIGGFSADVYWSSTEYNIYNAKGLNFTDGGYTNAVKESTYIFRPVRSFSIPIIRSTDNTGQITVSGSIIATTGITGSLFGTASYALNASGAGIPSGNNGEFQYKSGLNLIGSSNLSQSGSSLVLSGSLVSKAAPTVPVIDATPSTNVALYATSATASFPSFSGMIIFTNWSNSATTLAMCGGNQVNVQAFAGSFGNFGAWSYSNNAYVWTNTTGINVSASFTAIKTKNSV